MIYLPESYANVIRLHLQNKFNKYAYLSLLRKYRKDYEFLIIGGEEPTNRDDFFDLTKFSINPPINYEHLQLETNTKNFRDIIFLKKFQEIIGEDSKLKKISFKVFVDCFSISKYKENITKKRLNEIKKGILNIKNFLNNNIICSTTVDFLNYKYLLSIASFLTESGVSELEFFFMPSRLSFKKIKPYLNRLLDFCNEKNVKCYLCNLPLCFLKRREQNIDFFNYPLGSRTDKFIEVKIEKTREEKSIKSLCSYKNSCYYGLVCRGSNSFDPQPSIIKEKQKPQNKLDFKFDYFSFNNFNINNIKADTICHLSGGLDSKCAVALYANENPNKKIVLLTYDKQIEFPIQRSVITARELMRKYDNILGHFIILIPSRLVRKVIINQTEYWSKKFGMSMTCALCSMLYFCISIYFHKKYLKGEVILEGFRNGKNITSDVIKFKQKFAEKYGISLTCPVFEKIEKEEIKTLTTELGLSKAEGNQGECFLKQIRWGNNKVILENFSQSSLINNLTKFFEGLLSKNEVRSIK